MGGNIVPLSATRDTERYNRAAFCHLYLTASSLGSPCALSYSKCVRIVFTQEAIMAGTLELSRLQLTTSRSQRNSDFSISISLLAPIPSFSVDRKSVV